MFCRRTRWKGLRQCQRPVTRQDQAPLWNRREADGLRRSVAPEVVWAIVSEFIIRSRRRNARNARYISRTTPEICYCVSAYSAECERRSTRMYCLCRRCVRVYAVCLCVCVRSGNKRTQRATSRLLFGRPMMHKGTFRPVYTTHSSI